MKKILSKILLLIIGIIIGFITAEFALRIIGFSYKRMHKLDKKLGWRLQPNSEAWSRREQNIFYQTNKLGFRGRSFATHKPENIYRIIFLGDSYIAGLQVNKKATIVNKLEKKLNKCSYAGSKKVQVINLGIPGYSTVQEFLVFEEYAKEMNPDMILLGFASNDVINNYKPLESNKKRPFIKKVNGEIKVDTSFVQRSAFKVRTSFFSKVYYWLVNRFQVMQSLRKLYHLLQNLRGGKNLNDDTRTVKSLEKVYGTDHIYLSSPEDSQEKAAWRKTEKILKRLSTEAKNAGIEFILVNLTSPLQLLLEEKKQKKLKRKFSLSSLTYADTRLKEVGLEAEIPVINLRPHFSRYVNKHSEALHGFGKEVKGHWNEMGHQLGAKVVANKLCSTNLNR